MKTLFLACPKALWEQADRFDLRVGIAGVGNAGFVALCDRDQLANQTFEAGEDQVLISIDADALRNLLHADFGLADAKATRHGAQAALAAVRSVAPLQICRGRAVLPEPDASEPTTAAPFDPAHEGWVRLNERDNFSVMIGPVWARGDGQAGRYGFLATDKHLNRNGTVHGGMLLTFADKAMALTAWEAGGRPSHATIQLDTRFIRAVTSGRFVEARCRIVRQTPTLAFMDAMLVTGNDVVAAASGIWSCRRGSAYRGIGPEVPFPADGGRQSGDASY